MPQFSFINLKNPRNTGSGVAEKVYIALAEWFTVDGIKSPGAWAMPGDDVTIKETHVLKPSYGFIQCSLAPEKNSYDAKTIGDTGFQKFANQVNVVFPGSYADLHELIFRLMNKPVIILIKDSNCPANMMYQVGTSCVFAYVGANFSTGTTKDGFKGYSLEITNTASKVFLYAGEVTVFTPIVARLTGSITGSDVDLDASDSTINGTIHYQYEVLYNDVDDQPQSIILPEDEVTASFNTSALTNWNNAGFAVKLTITNESQSDVTLSSDSTGERPLIMGGFDEGFDEGFDFNI